MELYYSSSNEINEQPDLYAVTGYVICKSSVTFVMIQSAKFI